MGGGNQDSHESLWTGSIPIKDRHSDSYQRAGSNQQAGSNQRAGSDRHTCGDRHNHGDGDTVCHSDSSTEPNIEPNTELDIDAGHDTDSNANANLDADEQDITHRAHTDSAAGQPADAAAANQHASAAYRHTVANQHTSAAYQHAIANRHASAAYRHAIAAYRYAIAYRHAAAAPNQADAAGPDPHPGAAWSDQDPPSLGGDPVPLQEHSPSQITLGVGRPVGPIPPGVRKIQRAAFGQKRVTHPYLFAKLCGISDGRMMQ